MGIGAPMGARPKGGVEADQRPRGNRGGKLCSTMQAEDVTDTLDMALAASGCDQAHVRHKPRLLSDNGPSYIAGELAEYIEAKRMSHVRGAPFHPQTQGKIERWHQTLKNRILLENYFLPGDLEAQIAAFVELQPSALPREPRKCDTRRRLLRQGRDHHQTARKDQTPDNRTSALAAPQPRCITSIPRRGRHSANLN